MKLIVKNLRKYSIYTLIILVFLTVIFFLKDKKDTYETTYTPEKTHASKFFNEKTFHEGLWKTFELKPSFPHRITGGIIPHDTTPGFILTDFFYILAKQKPKTIILIGPNHYEKGKELALTSRYGWETPFGIVDPNKQIIQQLIDENVIHTKEDVLENEHSVSGIMPFIKKFMPETQVVPIILSAWTKENECQKLANSLEPKLNQDSVLIASVDFSHYLSMAEANKKDIETLEVIKNFEYQRLYELNNDYLDSPPTICTLLKTLQLKGTTQMEVLHHTNLGELVNRNDIETTSYYSILYY
jgi:AmmeMemoRadiSam system protein B